MIRWRDRLLAAFRPGGRQPADPQELHPRPVRRQSRSAPSANDVIAAIAPQHEHVKGLLEAVRQQAGHRRAAAFHTLRLTLALHETAEQQAIHPLALHQLGAHERAASDRIAEEQTAGQTIGALEMVNVDSDQFNATFGRLATAVIDHAAAEEADEWPALRQITDPPVIKAMVEQMQAVSRLTSDPSAPGIQATFTQMQEWAKAHLPTPPAP